MKLLRRCFLAPHDYTAGLREQFAATWQCSGCRNGFLFKSIMAVLTVLVLTWAVADLGFVTKKTRTHTITMTGVSRIIRYEACTFEFMRVAPRTKDIVIWSLDNPCPRIVADVPPEDAPWVRATERVIRYHRPISGGTTTRTMLAVEIHVRNVFDLDRRAIEMPVAVRP